MKDNQAKYPQLRFKGFTDPWEQRKLGEVATFLNGRAYKQDELLDSGKYKVLRVGNFYTNDSWYYSNMELGDKYYVDKGDLVYTWSATFGPHIWSGEKVIYHYHIWKVELSKFLDRNFTLQLLEADKARLLSSTNGSTMIHVTKGDMESKIVSIPNIDEQKQIGSFFKQLDNTITLHQRKLAKLKELKQGYLQKLFPKNGSKFPQLRFSGFADAWEERKLGDEVKINGRIGFRGYTQADIVTKETGVLAYSPTNIVNNRLYRKQSDTYITKQKYRESPEIMVKNSDILFVKTGSTLGKSALVQGINYHATVNPQIVIIRSNELDEYFLSVILTSYNILKRINTIKIGGAIPTMTETELKKFPIQVPKRTEQKKIGSFFKQLDNTIDLHQRKLEKLQELKKGYLQKMFC